LSLIVVRTGLPRNPLQPDLPHQPLDRAPGDGNAFAAKLAPDLASAVDLEVFGEDPGDLGLQHQIPPGWLGQLGGIAAPGRTGVIDGWGDRQDLAWPHPLRSWSLQQPRGGSPSRCQVSAALRKPGNQVFAAVAQSNPDLGEHRFIGAVSRVMRSGR
jgi:hypothetical protein